MSKPDVPQKAPYIVTLPPGKYYWCACGSSKKQPFCDGTHKGTGFTPVTFEVTMEGQAALCGCKNSANKPYCDGSHKKL